MAIADPYNITQPEPLLIVISGPSGVGKDSVIERMRERGVPFRKIVTATTRPPRQDEENGVDYFFLSHEEFAGMIERDELLEFAHVYEDYKGIPKAQVREALASGLDVVMRVDVQGAEKVREICPDALLIFLTTRDEDELVRRLQARKSESPGSLKIRIATARKELKRVDLFDYVVVNHQDRLDEAVDTIKAIIRAEHHRLHPRKVTI